VEQRRSKFACDKTRSAIHNSIKRSLSRSTGLFCARSQIDDSRC
jgi:hypothetical protein